MASATSSIQHVLIGTAGHIDHGKTRLVANLTGIDTDRLPEEKARGISIDLGFAHWETDGFRFGVVDVPGHERFVRNMVAGATGVNIGLLVVAADDSVMPQTREHLEIMDLLGIPIGVVAITKTDIVEPDFVELVQADIDDLVEGTFLAGAPIVPVSSETGEGIDHLRQTLADVAAKLTWQQSHGLFRMPIDRVFSIEGHGTVVTGSVRSGEVKQGDTVELLPECREVRVRSVQNHGSQADDSGARRRTAVNLAGVKTDELRRGQELSAPGFLQPTQRLIVELRNLGSSGITLKDRIELNLHLGTGETPARVIFKGLQLKPGDRAFAELRTKEPVAAEWGQRFILRRISPAITVAGGRILDPGVAPLKRIRDLSAYASAMAVDSERDRFSYLASQHDSIDDTPESAVWRAGVARDRFREFADELLESGRLVALGSSSRQLLVHRDRLDAVSKSVMRTIREELARQQPRRSLPRKTLVNACRDITGSTLLDAVLDNLIKAKELVLVGPNLGPADAQVQLTKKQRAAQAQMLDAINAAGLAPPTRKELSALTGLKLDDVNTLLNVCVEDGLLVDVSNDLCFSPEAIENARRTCAELLANQGPATMAQIRDAWGVTRKFAVPLCEYFDTAKVTVRNGDVREPGPEVDQSVV